MFILLNRDTFRNAVFERDNYKCIVCGESAVDAHHIIERKLFDDGGYYIDNGVSLCEKHHLEAEMTVISTDKLRQLANISKIILPGHLYSDSNYDKWGNEILPNGQRIPGDLFNEEPVQKILGQANVLNDFTRYIKYPRTHHLPWSDGRTSDDKIMRDTSLFKGKYVILTEKMDGENTSMYTDYIHARSINSNNHPSRNWVKGLWSQVGYNIPEGWRVCGENLYAKHSIHYKNLKSYFYMFSIWDEKNICLSWDETVEWSILLGLELVPVLYDGIWDEEVIRNLDIGDSEGYVVRLKDEFHYSEFRKSVAKFVRSNHVQTSNHWTTEKIVKNNLND